MRYRARVDANQPGIVAALRKLPGVTAHPTAALGRGFPDVAVGYAGRSYLFELKDPSKPPSARKLTPDEEAFHTTWTGHVEVALTWQDIAKAIRHPLAALDSP